MRCWGREYDFIQKASRPRRWRTSVPKNHLTQDRIQASFVLKGEEVWLVVTNFLVSESFVLAAVHIGQVTDVPVNLQQDKGYSLFCNSLSLYEWKSVIPLKVRALRTGSPVYFRLQETFFYKRCRASMTKHRPQGTKVKEKGTDLMWSQICSSPLHYGRNCVPPQIHMLKS